MEVIFETLTHKFYSNGTSVSKIEYSSRKTGLKKELKEKEMSITFENNTIIKKVTCLSGNYNSLVCAEDISNDGDNVIYEF